MRGEGTGYYSTVKILSFGVKTTVDKAVWFNTTVAKNMRDDCFYLRLMTGRREGKIAEAYLANTSKEDSGEFYEARRFAVLLSRAIEEGIITMEFEGEDGVRWGYRIVPGVAIEREYEVVERQIGEKDAYPFMDGGRERGDTPPGA